MIYLYEQIQLVSYDKVVSTVKEQICKFVSEKEMHKHCAAVAFNLEAKGLAFNGTNASRHFVYLTRELSEDEVKFVFG
jgi:predicted nucleotidyltransferase